MSVEATAGDACQRGQRYVDRVQWQMMDSAAEDGFIVVGRVRRRARRAWVDEKRPLVPNGGLQQTWERVVDAASRMRLGVCVLVREERDAGRQ